jgi:hypothetical protein
VAFVFLTSGRVDVAFSTSGTALRVAPEPAGKVAEEVEAEIFEERMSLDSGQRYNPRIRMAPGAVEGVQADVDIMWRSVYMHMCVNEETIGGIQGPVFNLAPGVKLALG